MRMTGSRLGLAVAAVIVVIGVIAGIGLGEKVKAVIAGVVTVSYDPVKGRLALAADPVALASKFITLKVGDEIPLTDDSNKATVVIMTPTERAKFEVDVQGSWSVSAYDVAGPSVRTGYDAERHVYNVDLSHTYATRVDFARSVGPDSWSEIPIEKRIATYPVVVDTKLLTTGTFTYCGQDPQGCGLYLHTLATLDSASRVMRPSGEPVRIPNGAKLHGTPGGVMCRDARRPIHLPSGWHTLRL